MTIKFSLDHPHIRKRLRDLHRLVITKTIHHHNLSGPPQSPQHTRNIRRLVIGKNQRGNPFQHPRSSVAKSACVTDHVFPEPRDAAVEAETEIFEAVAFQQLRERADAEEFDMPAIVQRREVRVHLARRGEHEIFQIPVIRRAEQYLTTRLKKYACGVEQIGRTIHVLDHVARNHKIKFPESELTIDQRFNKLNLRVCTSRDRYPTRRRIDPSDLVSQFGKSPGDMPIPASQIANRSDSIKRLHKLDEDARQLLARFAIARTLGAPLKLGIRGHCDTNQPTRAPNSPTNTSAPVAIR